MVSFIARLLRATIPVVIAAVVAACAAPAAVPSTEQPALARMATPYATDLRNAGINSVMVYANKARVRVSTRLGEVYFRYPADIAPTDFALYVGSGGVEVDSDGYNAGNAAQYEAALKAVLPEAVRRAAANNTQELQQRLIGR